MHVSQADFAKILGVSKTMVTKYKAKGYLVFVQADDGRDRVDVAASIDSLDGNIDEAHMAKGRAFLDRDDDSDDVAEIAATSGAGAKQADLKVQISEERLRAERRANAVAEGELVDASEIWGAVTHSFSELKVQLTTSRRRLAEQCFAAKDVRELIALIKKRDEDALNQLHVSARSLDTGPAAVEEAAVA